MSTTVLNPKAERFAGAAILQPKHLEHLTGAIGGFLSNNKPNADEFLSLLVKKFEAVHGMPSHLLINKKNPSLPAAPELIEQVSQSCKFAVCAIGD